MTREILRITISILLVSVLGGCAYFSSLPEIPTSTESVAPATTITRGGTPQKLIGEPISIGQPLPDLQLTDRGMRPRSLAEFKGRTVLLSITPSLDTQVCERQTHLLGEAADAELPAEIVRVTITRDLPFAQSRFALETGFENILYLSDFKSAEFGMGTGLLVDELRLLARAVMVVDKAGVIRYLQVVPEMSHLPDMSAAFAIAREVAAE